MNTISQQAEEGAWGMRVAGRKMAALNAAIHDRDGNQCIICSRWVDPGEKFHHEPCGPNKQDRIECGVVLCIDCHNERHFGKKLREYREKIMEYLRRQHPEYWRSGGTEQIGEGRAERWTNWR